LESTAESNSLEKIHRLILRNFCGCTQNSFDSLFPDGTAAVGSCAFNLWGQ